MPEDKELETVVAYFKAKLAAEVQKVDVVKKVKEGKGDFILLDARDPGSFAAGHIPGAVSLPLSEVEARLKGLDRQKTYVTYCWNRT